MKILNSKFQIPIVIPSGSCWIRDLLIICTVLVCCLSLSKPVEAQQTKIPYARLVPIEVVWLSSTGEAVNKIATTDGAGGVIWTYGEAILSGIRDTLALYSDSLADHEARITELEISKQDTLSFFEKTISVNDDVGHTVPFMLRPTAHIWFNGSLLKQDEWTGIGSTDVTLLFNTRIYDYIKIQN